MPTSTTIKRMSNTCEQATNQLRRGPWTLEEDTLLMHYIANHGEGHWNAIAKSAGLKRTGKSCRLRWLNYLKPDIKRGNLSPQEQLLILELHSKLGNRWSKIAQHLPGRTDNEIKNYWRTRVQKQARQLNIESNSKKFVEAVRCFWMPRLLQKMEQTSSDFSTSSLTNLSNHQNYSAPSLSIKSPVPYDMSPSSSKLVQSSIDNSNEYTSCITCPSSTISTDCNMVSQIPQISEFPNSPCNHDFGEATVYNDFVMDESYYVNNFSYDMEGGLLNLDHNSALGNFGNSQFDYQMEASDNWVLGDMTDTLWNL